MKKSITLLLITLMAVFALSACGDKDKAAEDSTAKTENVVVKVGASVTPHAEILAVAKPIMEKAGFTLEVIEFNDYVQPNLSVESGELDANYFQHKPYLDEFNVENNTKLLSVATIHYEPFGIYPGKIATLDKLVDGATIAVPNDGTNEARALLLLEQEGLITLKAGVGLSATALDIEKNTKNLKIQEIEAAQLARSIQDVDMAVINGNYAIEAGLSVANDSIATEDAKSESATTYANIIAVAEGHEEDAGIKALIAALQSDEVKAYMEKTYDGAVIPCF